MAREIVEVEQSDHEDWGVFVTTVDGRRFAVTEDEYKRLKGELYAKIADEARPTPVLDESRGIGVRHKEIIDVSTKGHTDAFSQFDLSDVSTAQLTNELAKREGISVAKKTDVYRDLPTDHIWIIR